MNLLMVCLDTFRADVAYSGDLPNLSALAGNSTVFLNTVSSAPITPISHASIFTGLQPYEHGIRHLMRETLQTDKPTLAQVIGSAGYATGAIVSCPGLNRWYGLDAGFDHYDDEVPRLADGRDPLELADVKLRGAAMKRAPQVVERSLNWLDSHRHEPFFLFSHFFDTHYPYEAPERYGPDGINAYEGEAHYVDHYLGVLMQQVSDWGLLEDTCVIILSDHGEDLNGWYANDHGGPELGHPEEEGHGCLLFDATQLVPLVILGPPPVGRGLVVPHQVRLVDLFPTALDLLGIESADQRAGESLEPLFWGEGGDRPAYCEAFHREEQVKVPGLAPWYGVRVDRGHKMIVDAHTGAISLFDLEADPEERCPVVHGPVR